MRSSICREMVSRLEIFDHTYQSYPCEHPCQLTLIDGRIAIKELSGVNICILIRFLAKDKVMCSSGTAHFDEFDCLDWYEDSLSSPEKILSLFIFNP